MESTFRQSMNWLHTWAGVVLGGLIFAIFWTGTLAVFNREIDRWMMPMTRLATPVSPNFQLVKSDYEAGVRARAPTVHLVLPTERQPVFQIAYRDGTHTIKHWLDPETGAVLPTPGTLAGSGFIYPFHINLHLRAWNIGVWLVGFAGIAFLALCVTGVIIHRKIFADFFTLRTKKKSRRVILDLHNVTGVLALPFHIAITLSGLIIFFYYHFPSGWQAIYPNRAALNAEVFNYDDFTRPALKRPGPFPALETIYANTERLWPGEKPRFLTIIHPGDAAAYVKVFQPDEYRVTSISDFAYFDAATGELLQYHPEQRPIVKAQRFISGFHLIRFTNWTLRWLYFCLGLSSCVMIATGYLFWLESRRKRHQQLRLGGVRVVEGLTVGSVTGIVIATLVFFVVNRLLPLDFHALGQSRSALEVWSFYLAWLASFVHGWARSYRAWIEQCWCIGVLATVAVGLNWLTTGDHLLRSLTHDHLSAVAGMDFVLLMGAFIAVLTARKLRLREAAGSPRPDPAASAKFHLAE